MARSKRDWQQESSPQTRPTSVTARAGDNSWRKTPASLRSRLLSQLGLLRVPVYTFVAAGLIWSLIHILGWLRPVERPRLTMLTSTYSSPLVPQNAHALNDARILIGSEAFQASEASASSQNKESMLAAIRSISRNQQKGWLSKFFGWASTTDVVYVNALGMALPNADKSLSPYILPADFDSVTPEANENAVPVSEILDAITESSAERKLVVFDCRGIEQLWSKGVLQNQFVASVEQLLEQNAARYGDIAVLFSSSAGESTWVDHANQTSVFARFFTEGMEGAADQVGNKDNRVTLSELERYVSANVPRWVASNRVGSQHPFLLNSPNTSDVVLALANTEARGNSPEPPDTTEVLTNLQSAWEELGRLANAERHPTRFAPTLWMELQQSLLRAESAYRMADKTASERELNHVRQLVGQLDQLAAEKTEPATAWSLADARSRIKAEDKKVTAEDKLNTGQKTPSKQAVTDVDDKKQPLAVPLIPQPSEVRSTGEAVDVVDRFLAGDLELTDTATQLQTAHKHGVKLFAEAELIVMLANDSPDARGESQSQFSAKARQVVAD
ncbi:MAG: hypothetical protein AB8G99_19065, partial [Planctomycetaceae bacterium]